MSTRLCRWAQRTFRCLRLDNSRLSKLVGQIQELVGQILDNSRLSKLVGRILEKLVGQIQELTQQLAQQLAMIQRKSALQNIKWFSNALASLRATCCS